MGEPPAATRPSRPATTRGAPLGTTYAPDPEDRARLAFADGPAPTERSGSRPAVVAGEPRASRLALVGATAAVVAVIVVAVLAFGLADQPDSAPNEVPDRPLDRGPFDSVDEFVLALHLPASFTRLAPEDASSFADADYVVDGEFDAACAGLGRALQDMDPTFPALVPQEYTGGGVNRCEASGPMAALRGANVRALVLKANTGAQLYIDDLAPTSSPSTTLTPPTSPPPSSTP